MSKYTMRMEREISRQVVCPKCEAQVGEPCKNKYGEDAPRSHERRITMGEAKRAYDLKKAEAGGLSDKDRRRMGELATSLEALADWVRMDAKKLREVIRVRGPEPANEEADDSLEGKPALLLIKGLQPDIVEEYKRQRLNTEEDA